MNCMKSLAAQPGRHGVQGDDTGGVHVGIVDVSLVGDLNGITKGFLGQAYRVDQLVAREASWFGSEGANDGEDVEDVAGLLFNDRLRPHLQRRDQVLVGDLVDDARSRASCRQRGR